MHAFLQNINKNVKVSDEQKIDKPSNKESTFDSE